MAWNIIISWSGPQRVVGGGTELGLDNNVNWYYSSCVLVAMINNKNNKFREYIFNKILHITLTLQFVRTLIKSRIFIKYICLENSLQSVQLCTEWVQRITILWERTPLDKWPNNYYYQTESTGSLLFCCSCKYLDVFSSVVRTTPATRYTNKYICRCIKAQNFH